MRLFAILALCVVATYCSQFARAAEPRFVKAWGREGVGDGEFMFCIGVAINAQGELFVVDSYNQRIQKFATR